MNHYPEWVNIATKPVNASFFQRIESHQNSLTKPPGSLGDLEKIASQIAVWQESLSPSLEHVQIIIFAGDHGIAEEQVSAFPQAVTAEMVRNFANGGAAISVLAKFSNTPLKVINMGTVVELEPLAWVEDCRIAGGTENFLQQPAMSFDQLLKALDSGKAQAELAQQDQIQLLILGEMGIANTSSASAIAAALFELKAEQICGRGTGLDDDGVLHKMQVINAALAYHGSGDSPLDILKNYGGFEIAAMVGCYLRAAQLGIPALVDGFIATVAAIVAIKINPDAQQWMLFAHRSAEQGHRMLLDFIDAKPLLELDMRLGEASGAAIALPILRAACALNNQMATFSQANVSTN